LPKSSIVWRQHYRLWGPIYL